MNSGDAQAGPKNAAGLGRAGPQRVRPTPESPAAPGRGADTVHPAPSPKGGGRLRCPPSASLLQRTTQALEAGSLSLSRAALVETKAGWWQRGCVCGGGLWRAHSGSGYPPLCISLDSSFSGREKAQEKRDS